MPGPTPATTAHARGAAIVVSVGVLSLETSLVSRSFAVVVAEVMRGVDARTMREVGKLSDQLVETSSTQERWA